MSSPAFLSQAALGLLLMFPYPQEPKSVGEVIDIGCAAEVLKPKADPEKDKWDKLNPKQDRGRKLLVGERYRCTGPGILKLRINGGHVDVKPEMKWYPIAEPSDGNSDD